MEERSLKIYADKTFFTKITNTITKMLIPTKIGINGMLISMKRNNVIKAYENYESASQEREDKKAILSKKYEDAYSLYLEAIDKYIMDSIYKKVKNDTATDFEKQALSKYYEVIHIKEAEYLEYKYAKQKYLLNLDYETVKELGKVKLLEKYNEFYLSKVDTLYKGILKHFSIKLADNLTYQNKEEIYEKIFINLEEYIENILPLKMEKDQDDTYKEILDEYEKFERYSIGKLDQNETIEKRMALLAMSRKLFTHSLPLVVAEQCYIKLLKDVRSLIVDTRVIKKQEKAYSLLIKLIEDYNVKLLSTKIYWDKPSAKEAYKAFWEKYKELEKIKNIDYISYMKQKEILFIKSDLQEVRTNELRYEKIIKFYKEKLVELGAMRKLKNSYVSNNKYIKGVNNRKKTVKA